MPKIGEKVLPPDLHLLSPYARHKRQWKDCTKCELHKTRRHVVLARGTIPCDVLFIGEAPGQSENVLGLPFCGPAGHLMDSIIKRSLCYNLCAECGCPRKLEEDSWVCRYGHTDTHSRDLTYALTNLVGCIPLGDDGEKVAQPPADSITACTPRLEEFIALANPRLIVCVGTLSSKWLEQGYRHSVTVPPKTPIIHVLHPAAILRQNTAQQGLSIQRAIVVISDAVVDFK